MRTEKVWEGGHPEFKKKKKQQKWSHANFGFGGFCEIVRVTVMHFIRSINYINWLYH